MTEVFLLAEVSDHAWRNLGYGDVAKRYFEQHYPDHPYEMAIVYAACWPRDERSDEKFPAATAMLDVDIGTQLQHWYNVIRGHARVRSELRKDAAVLARTGGTKEGDEAIDKFFERFPPEAPEGYEGKEVLLDLGEGWRWVSVSGDACQGYEGQLMQHCGKAGRYGEDMISLRDPQGKPHVTAELNRVRKVVKQLKGKQNNVVSEKYWDAVGQLLKHLKEQVGHLWGFEDSLYLDSQEGTDFLEFLDEFKYAYTGWDKNLRFGAAQPPGGDPFGANF